MLTFNFLRDLNEHKQDKDFTWLGFTITLCMTLVIDAVIFYKFYSLYVYITKL
jgi:hypothetical protein